MGLLRGVARTAVVAGTATAVSNRVSRRQAGRWAEQEQAPGPQPEAAATAPQPEAAAPADLGSPENAMDQKIAQLKQLGDLKAQGILSESEFDAQKRQILGT